MKAGNVIMIVLLLFLLYVISKESDIPARWNKLKTLHPSVKNKFIQFIKEIEKRGYKVMVTSSHRTYEQQLKFYNEDHRNGAPGNSTHEKDTGIDFVLFTSAGKMIGKKTPKPVWISTGVPALAKEYGMRWGGDFKTYFDPVHFDYLTA